MQVLVGIRRGLTVQRSAHALFTSDAIAVRASFRGCAARLWEAPRTLVEGSGTFSPFVVRQAR